MVHRGCFRAFLIPPMALLGQSLPQVLGSLGLPLGLTDGTWLSDNPWLLLPPQQALAQASSPAGIEQGFLEEEGTSREQQAGESGRGQGQHGRRPRPPAEWA